jgi:hypothetical protein
MVVYEKPGYLQVAYEEAKGYVIFRWEKFAIPLEDIKAAHKAAWDTAKSKGCPYYIAQTASASGALLPDVVDWFTNQWVPLLRREGLTAIATIVPETSALARISTKSWQTGDFDGIVMENVKSLEEAESLIAEIKVAKR